MRVIVCWEDKYHGALDRALRRVRGAAREPPHRELQPWSARGYGGFRRVVELDWPIFRSTGHSRMQGKADHLVCIADADRAGELPGVSAPTLETDLDDWVPKAEEAWTVKLRDAATCDPERVSGKLLRWNKESLVIAGFEVDKALRLLGIPAVSTLEEFLADCAPDPRSVDGDFADPYRSPGTCLKGMLAAAGASGLKKNSVAHDDAIDVLSSESRELLVRRVPDLQRLADHLNRLT